MSLVSSRLALKQRCTVERKTVTPDGGGGQTEAWNPIATDVLCRAWFDADPEDRQVVDGARVTIIEDRRVIVPLGTVVREGDRLTQVTDTAGAVVFPGPMLIDMAGRHSTHIELFVREVT